MQDGGGGLRSSSSWTVPEPCTGYGGATPSSSIAFECGSTTGMDKVGPSPTWDTTQQRPTFHCPWSRPWDERRRTWPLCHGAENLPGVGLRGGGQGGVQTLEQ